MKVTRQFWIVAAIIVGVVGYGYVIDAVTHPPQKADWTRKSDFQPGARVWFKNDNRLVGTVLRRDFTMKERGYVVRMWTTEAGFQEVRFFHHELTKPLRRRPDGDAW